MNVNLTAPQFRFNQVCKNRSTAEKCSALKGTKYDCRDIQVY